MSSEGGSDGEGSGGHSHEESGSGGGHDHGSGKGGHGKGGHGHGNDHGHGHEDGHGSGSDYDIHEIDDVIEGYRDSDTYDMPYEQTGATLGSTDSPLAEALNRAGFSETHDIMSDGIEGCVYDHEIAKLHARVHEGLHEEHSDDPTLKEQLETLIEMGALAVKNAFDITAGKYIVEKEMEHAMHDLHHGDKVLVFVHGWMQNVGAAREYMNQMKGHDMKFVAITYDNANLFERGTKQVYDQIKSIYDITGMPVSMVCHSDGGKVVMNAIQRYEMDAYLDRVVLSQADINGDVNTLPLHYALGGLPPNSSIDHLEGKKYALNLHARHVDGVEVIVGNGLHRGTWNGDGLVRQESAYYPGASSYTAVKANHFGGAGGAGGPKSPGSYNDVTTHLATNSWDRFNHENGESGKLEFAHELHSHSDDMFHGASTLDSHLNTWYGHDHGGH